MNKLYKHCSVLVSNMVKPERNCWKCWKTIEKNNLPLPPPIPLTFHIFPQDLTEQFLVSCMEVHGLKANVLAKGSLECTFS